MANVLNLSCMSILPLSQNCQQVAPAPHPVWLTRRTRVIPNKRGEENGKERVQRRASKAVES